MRRWLRQHGGVRRISCESGNSSQLTVGRTDRRQLQRAGRKRCSDSATINIPLRSRNLSAPGERERKKIERDARFVRAPSTHRLPRQLDTPSVKKQVEVYKMSILNNQMSIGRQLMAPNVSSLWHLLVGN